MENNYYMTNRQKLLFMAKELHKRGYEKLRVIPSLSPSGLSWRCSFIDGTRDNSVIASCWIYQHEKEGSKEEIALSSKELADLFVRENAGFIKQCKGENKEYVKWYSDMVDNLEKNELPYAFSDYFFAKDMWETSEGNRINTLSNEYKYYYDY